LKFSNKEKLHHTLSQMKDTCKLMEASLWPSEGDHSMPSIALRHRILEEFGYVVDGRLSPHGLLASEINEGHPFIMTQLFLKESKSLKPLSQKNILTCLSVFLGEKRDDAVQNPYDLNVDKEVIETILFMNNCAKGVIGAEKAYGLPYDGAFWEMSLEWVEPISEWLSSDISLPELAGSYQLFEGNAMKALMKLAGLVEEFQAMASLNGEVEMLRVLEGARELVLRDIVLAESLYLRI
jgi:superfamily II RNA helicase